MSCNIINVRFVLLEDREKSLKVIFKTGKIKKLLFIPKSIIISIDKHERNVRLWKGASYTVDVIDVDLPDWFVEKEIKPIKNS